MCSLPHGGDSMNRESIPVFSKCKPIHRDSVLLCESERIYIYIYIYVCVCVCVREERV